MRRVPDRTVQVGHDTTMAASPRTITGRLPRTSGLAGVATVVLAPLIAQGGSLGCAPPSKDRIR
jgi:hypothetical protein